MKNKKPYVTATNSQELADILELDSEDGVAMEFRAVLNKKIVELVKKQGVTHAQLAQKVKASRTRITAILGGQTLGVSTDYLLRILHALGCRTKPTFLMNKAA